jgi:peptidylprolyl isomerase
MQTKSGLTYIEKKAGKGKAPKKGDVVSVHYAGTLEANGKAFDSSYDRNQPLDFKLGVGQVIAGWDEGIALMKEGGEATLIIPPNLGYGAGGAGNVIPPHAALIVEVTLGKVQ